jgi:hypothetical protein
VDAAIERDPIFMWASDDALDGWMSDEEMLGILPNWITVAPDAIPAAEFLSTARYDDLVDRTLAGLQAAIERIDAGSART